MALTMQMIESAVDIAGAVAPPPFGAELAAISKALKAAGPAGDIFLATLEKLIGGTPEEEVRRATLPDDGKIETDLMGPVGKDAPP